MTLLHGSGTFQTDPESLAYSTPSVCVLQPGTRGWIAYEFCRHRELFIVFYWFKEHVLAAMMMMTEQLVSSAMNQMFIIGAFFDAKQQLETQQLIQELAAKAHKDYHPSIQMCEIGTLSRSLGASQRRGEFTAYALSQRMIDRQMLNHGISSSGGTGADSVHRWEQFRQAFCNATDNDNELGPQNSPPICTGRSWLRTNLPRNRDVDYMGLLLHPNTISVNFTDNSLNYREESVFALASNLYGQSVFEYFPQGYFTNPANHGTFMYVRSIVAKRSVAQNSFNNLVALKAAGTAQSDLLRPHMEAVMEQLGITNQADRQRIIAGTLDDGFNPGFEPSYYAQMELLTKRLYQRPEFYTGLYDKPANVERIATAMRALGLVQNMDLFKSKLRSEASLAVLTEMELFKQQEIIQNRMSNAVRNSGIR